MYDGPLDDGAALATWAAAVLEGRLANLTLTPNPNPNPNQVGGGRARGPAALDAPIGDAPSGERRAGGGLRVRVS